MASDIHSGHDQKQWRQSQAGQCGRRHTYKINRLSPTRLAYIKSRQAQGAADRKDHDSDPPKSRSIRVHKDREIDHQRRRDPEIEKIGQCVQFGSNFTLTFQSPRQPAIGGIQNHCQNQQIQCHADVALQRRTDRSQPNANAENRYDIR